MRAMRVTYPEAEFNFIDVTALEDSQVSSTTIKSFADPALLKEDIRQTDYGTLELNQFLLDGSKEIFSRDPPEDIPYFSSEMSDQDGTFLAPPVLEVHFTESHSSVGITLYFAGDVPETVRITWYTLYGTELETAEFHPTSQEYFCSHNVRNYGGLSISFPETSWPCRYVKLDYLEYGRMWPLSRDNIKTASVYEEIDVTSATLSINTASIELIDTENEFGLDNQSGLWGSLQKEQEIRLTEYVNGMPVDCGTFYLDAWSSQQNLVSFSLIDRIGIMDKTDFYGGRIYDHEPAGVIIAEIMASCGIQRYSVEEEIYQMEVSGWLGIQSHRAALQQVVFACGAVADCSRSNWIRIYKPDRYVSHTIGLERKFLGTKISLDDYISDVSVAYTQYVLSAESKQISKSVLPAGRSRIEFSDPYLAESLEASAGTILEAAVNYVVIEMEQAGECQINGRKYDAVENTHTASIPVLEAGEIRKVKNYSGCTLMSPERAREAAESILGYYQMRQIVEMRYINDGEAVGNWCDIALMGGGHATTGITSQTIDLTGGNIADVKCRGYSRSVTSYYFTGTELYAGDALI